MASRREEAVNEFLGGAEYSDSDEAFESLFLAMGHIIFKKVGLKGDHNVLTREVLERFWLMENWAIYPDVIDALERLRAEEIRLGILSNATSDLVGFLEEIGLLGRFDFAIVSAIEGIKKPDRRIFERALERAGVAASNAAHVGDMYLEDILGARNVGVRPFLIDRGANSLFPNYPEAADHSPEEVEIVQGLDPMLDAIGIE
jgi:HAD superfamily hydrolase (TIGR01549 family)